MEFQTLPIVGVGTENGSWKAELDSFCCHGNPGKTYKNLLKFFGDPNHAGLLGSLLVMKQKTLQDSQDSGFTQMRLLAEKAAELTGQLFSELTDSNPTETPAAIFKTCKERFADALLNLCNCPDCRRTAAALATFRHPGRLPKLTPHHKKCPSESKLTPLYNASLLSGWVDLDETRLKGLSADADMFWDFENSQEMALLASILYTSYCHHLLSRLHVGVINFIDEQVRKIVEFGAGKSGDCIISRALEMVKNHSRGTADLHVHVNPALLRHRPQDPVPRGSLSAQGLEGSRVSDDVMSGSKVSDQSTMAQVSGGPLFQGRLNRGSPQVTTDQLSRGSFFLGRLNKDSFSCGPNTSCAEAPFEEQEEDSLIDQFSNSMTLDNDSAPESIVSRVPLIPLILHHEDDDSGYISQIPDDSVLTTRGPEDQMLGNWDTINFDDNSEENEEDFFDPFLEDNEDLPEYLDLDDFENLLYMDPSEFSKGPLRGSPSHKKQTEGAQFNPYFRQLV